MAANVPFQCRCGASLEEKMEEAYDSLCYSVRSDDLLLCQTFIPNSEIETVVGRHKPTFQLHRSILEILVEQVRSKYRNEFEIPFMFL